MISKISITLSCIDKFIGLLNIHWHFFIYTCILYMLSKQKYTHLSQINYQTKVFEGISWRMVLWTELHSSASKFHCSCNHILTSSETFFSLFYRITALSNFYHILARTIREALCVIDKLKEIEKFKIFYEIPYLKEIHKMQSICG